jgi:hypothetical protein
VGEDGGFAALLQAGDDFRKVHAGGS